MKTQTETNKDRSLVLSLRQPTELSSNTWCASSEAQRRGELFLNKRIYQWLLAGWLSLSASILLALDVSLAWLPSPSPDATYKVYGHTNSLLTTALTNALVQMDVGTNLTATVTNLDAASRWYFVVTATTNNVESEPSNQVSSAIPRGKGTARITGTWTLLNQ